MNVGTQIQDDNSLWFCGNHTNIQAHLNLYAYANNSSSDSKTFHAFTPTFYYWASLRGEWSSWTCLFMMTSSTSTSSRSLCRKSDMKLDTDSYVMWPHSTICLHATHETREQRRRNSSRLYDAKNYHKSVYWGPIAWTLFKTWVTLSSILQYTFKYYLSLEKP